MTSGVGSGVAVGVLPVAVMKSDGDKVIGVVAIDDPETLVNDFG